MSRDPDAVEEPAGSQSLQWRGSWAVQLWIDELGAAAPVEVFKVSVAPGETFERALEARPGSRARVIVVSGPDLAFRSRVELVDGHSAQASEPPGPTVREWNGTNRLDLTLPREPGRVRVTLATERSGQARIDFDVGPEARAG